MGTDLKTDLVLNALNMAVQQRRPGNVIHHSDQGSQYTSVAFGLRCKEAGVRPSMGSVGDAAACPRAGAAGPGGQRHVRERLRDARMRTASTPQVPDEGGGPHGRLRLRRGMVQPVTPPPASSRPECGSPASSGRGTPRPRPARAAGLSNIDGDDSRMDADHPSVASVARRSGGPRRSATPPGRADRHRATGRGVAPGAYRPRGAPPRIRPSGARRRDRTACRRSRGRGAGGARPRSPAR